MHRLAARKKERIDAMTVEQQVFSLAEVEAFRADDRSAATAIVGLMAGIFALGLIGYLGVCLWVG
jgi:hypothetical protein